MPETSPLLPRTNRKKPVKRARVKLDTFEGVFLPTSLNVLSILMFLRFGFIVGQMGILGSLLLLVMSYVINVLTVLSISAISTNGTVKGGGAYYMISRSLGPEFGGAIGIIFFIGQILNASLNVVGFIEPLLVNFGKVQGDIVPLLPVSYLWQLVYSTILLAVCTGVAMVGSSLVSKTAFWLFVVLTISTLTIPVSALVMPAGYPLPPPLDNLKYTGITWDTFTENLMPHFTSGAAGSGQPAGVPETFRNMFGIFFPATAGIFAGASMSGELKNPSKSIPKGTLSGLLASFVLYFLVIVSLGASTPRELLHKDIKIIQSVSFSGLVIILGEVSTSLFSVIMGVVGAASMLNAIADDRIIPGLTIFAMAKKSPGRKRRAELYAILLTWFLAQVFLFADINQIATFITMAFLMTFLVTNLACFLLRVGAAPNFRPSFKYFSSKTALTGGVTSVIAMYICDGVSATSVIIFLVFLIMMIHYSTPPSKFGDISQLLIYHQVRKYLLRLKLNMSVKYWRPQILLLCDDPRTSWNLIGFCNHLKKGGLYILGHVVILNNEDPGNASEFTVQSFKEVQKQKNAWVKIRDMAKIKAFVHIALGPNLPWGVRNVFMGSGLGGMKPNITVLGFYDFHKHGAVHPTGLESSQTLPTDDCKKERKVSICQWVQIVEDLVIMQATVAVAANFRGMKIPVFDKSWMQKKLSKIAPKKKKYIDLYPIQMSTVCLLEDGNSVLSTNFDTYTLILQLGSILSTVDEWKHNGYVLRIIAFVESTAESEDEHRRLATLLESLRIDAEIKIVCLDDGSFNTYNILVKGRPVTPQSEADFKRISSILAEDQWWKNLVETRKAIKDINSRQSKGSQAISISDKLQDKLISFGLTPRSPTDISKLENSLQNNRRYTISNLHKQGLSLSLNMRAQGDESFFKYEEPFDSSDESDTERDMAFGTGSERSTVSNVQGVIPPPAQGRPKGPVETPKGPVETSKGPVENSKGPVETSKGSAETLKPDPKALVNKLTPQVTGDLNQRPSKSNLRPNFSAVKIPHSKIIDDEDDEEDEDSPRDTNDENDDDSEDLKPSIVFVEEGEHSDEETAKNDEKPQSERERSRSRSAKHRRPRSSSNMRKQIQSGFNPQKKPSSQIKTPSILTNDGLEHLNSPQFAESKPQKSVSVLDLTETTESPNTTYKQLQQELEEFTFNDLPAKGQHLILNEIMRKSSLDDETAVILSTLPPPAIGTHLDEQESLEYTHSLAIWLENLPPVLLVNSQTVTVTTAL